jgi:hypothetical protein
MRIQASVRALALVLLMALVTGAGSLSVAAADDNYRTKDGLAVYLGVLPATIVRGHPPGHPERAMHGGAPGDAATTTWSSRSSTPNRAHASRMPRSTPRSRSRATSRRRA